MKIKVAFMLCRRRRIAYKDLIAGEAFVFNEDKDNVCIRCNVGYVDIESGYHFPQNPMDATVIPIDAELSCRYELERDPS